MKLVLVLSVFALAGACKTDHAKVPSSADAGTTSASALDAPASANATVSDAPVTTSPPVHPPLPASDAGVSHSVFDRILVKPRDPAADTASIQALVEQTLRVKVVAARKSPGGWMMLQLDAASPARTVDDQQKIVAALQAVDAFATVEGDRMLKAR